MAQDSEQTPFLQLEGQQGLPTTARSASLKQEASGTVAPSSSGLRTGTSLQWRSSSSKRDAEGYGGVESGQYASISSAPPPADTPQPRPAGTAVGDPEEACTSRSCKICLAEEEGESDEDPDNPLISPCLCAGSSKYVHRKCLQRWRESNPTSKSYYRCEICHYEYRYRRHVLAAIIGSPATSALIFALALGMACFVLGFVPIIQGLLKLQGYSWVVHFLDGLIMTGLIGFCVMIVYLCMGGSCAGPGYAHDPTCCYFYGGDCGNCDCGGGGSDNGGMAVFCLIILAVMAAAGLLFTVVKGYVLLYSELRARMARYVVMVENVGGEAAAVSSSALRKGKRPMLWGPKGSSGKDAKDAAADLPGTFTLKPPEQQQPPQQPPSKGGKGGKGDDDCGGSGCAAMV